MADNNETEVGVRLNEPDSAGNVGRDAAPTELESLSQRIIALAILDETALEKIRVKPSAGTQTVVGELEGMGLLTPFQAAYVRAGEFEKLRLDEYLLLDKIGEGGMGEVFQARNLSLDRVEAIKVIRGDSSPLATRRFQQEAKALARLEHPGIVPVYRIGRHADSDFIAMKFVEGVTLRDKLREADETGTPFAIGQVCRWMVEAAEALGYAHRQGIIHRDVKPGNLMIASDGRVVVLDLGIAQLRNPGRAVVGGGLTQNSRGMGTPEFMPPEQWADARCVTPESDIYSLACTFFWVLTGKPAYSGEQIVDLMRAHSTEAVPKPSSIRPEIPAALDAIFLRALAKHPKDRFATMTDLVEALMPFAYEKQIVRTGLASSKKLSEALESATELMGESSGKSSDHGQRAWNAPVGKKAGFSGAAAAIMGVGCLAALWAASRLFGPTEPPADKSPTTHAATGNEAPQKQVRDPASPGTPNKRVEKPTVTPPEVAINKSAPVVAIQKSTPVVAKSSSAPTGATLAINKSAPPKPESLTHPFKHLRADAMNDDWSRHAIESMKAVLAANALAAKTVGGLRVTLVDMTGAAVEKLSVGVAVFPKLEAVADGYVSFVRFDGKELFILPIDDRIAAGATTTLKTRFSFSEPGRKRFVAYLSDVPLVSEPVLPDNAAEPTFPRLFVDRGAAGEILQALEQGRAIAGTVAPPGLAACRRVVVDLEVVP